MIPKIHQRIRFRLSRIHCVLLAGMALVCLWVMIDTHIYRSPYQTVEMPQNPVERQLWWNQVRGIENDKEKKQHAKKAIHRQLRLRETGAYRDAGINDWEDLGPKNIGGRIRAIAINPDDATEIYIGGVGGGVWRSADSGSNWSELTPSEFAYPVTSIAIDPGNTDVIYATTGEYAPGGIGFPGIGILKSSNGGSSWDTLPAPPGANFMWLAKIIINPLDPDILYAVGSTADEDQTGQQGVLYRSDDAGNTWRTQWLETVAPASANIFDIEINPTDTSELIIGTFRQALISNDSGLNFSSFVGPSPLITTIINGTGQRCELSYCPSNSSIIYILRYVVQDANADGTTDAWWSELWQTTDGGTNWAMLTSTQGNNASNNASNNILTTQGNYDNTIWVDPSNCNRAVMGGINLWKWSSSTLTRISEWSDDIGGNALGGNNSAHADQHIIVADPGYNGSSNNQVYIGNDGGIYAAANIWTATINSGWASLVSELNITQLYGADVSLTGDTLVAGAQDNSYFVDRSANSNDLTWQVYSTGDGGHGAIKKSNPEIIYASTQRGHFKKSADGGDTFCEVITLDNSNSSAVPDCGNFFPVNDSPLFIAPFEMDPNDDQTLYAGGQRLWQSTDEGANWSSIKSDVVAGRQISSIEIASGDGNTVWVGYDNGQVWRTTNGGGAWTQVDVPAMPNVLVTDIAIRPGDHNDVLVSFGGGYDIDVVWFSDDAGSTWTNRSLAFDMQTYSIIWHPETAGWAYLGTDLGIFATEDYGENWSITPLYSNHPSGNDTDGPVFTAVTELVWQGDGSNNFPYYLVAATHGRGVWRTSFPIREKYYVDKNCSPCGPGSFSRPYAFFIDAVEAAGNGAEIVFLSPGTYNEVPSSILLEKRIRVTLHSSVVSPVIIE